eukprot:362866-Chlamydomonas_euryale.AAC.17
MQGALLYLAARAHAALLHACNMLATSKQSQEHIPHMHPLPHLHERVVAAIDVREDAVLVLQPTKHSPFRRGWRGSWCGAWGGGAERPGKAATPAWGNRGCRQRVDEPTGQITGHAHPNNTSSHVQYQHLRSQHQDTRPRNTPWPRT